MRISLLAIPFFLFFASPTFAWDGSASGKITLFEATDAENYGFRVHVASGTGQCGAGTPGWSYVNKSFDNYDVFVSLLTSAFLAGKSVTIYSDNIGGYCRMAHIQIAG